MRLASKLLLVVTALVALAGPAQAGRNPVANPADPRIKSVVYTPQEVTELRGHYGRVILVTLGAGEIITDLNIGDPEAWHADVTSAENAFTLKPKLVNATTNLIVITNKRIYNFSLMATGSVDQYGAPAPPLANEKDQTYFVEFRYPDDERAAAEAARKAAEKPETESRSLDQYGWHYSWSGSEGAKPQRVFDDGKFTYFVFPKDATVPAVFAVDADGNESLVNFHRSGDYYVVHKVESQFTLRSGDYVTCIFNEAKPHPSATKFKNRKPV